MDVPTGVTQEEGHTEFLHLPSAVLTLIFLARKIQPFPSLVDRGAFVCCVCCHPISSGRQACGRTNRGHTGGRSHRISPPSFCGAYLNFSREKDSAIPFPRRP